MKPRADAHPLDGHTLLRERLAMLGIPHWRLTTDGTVTQAPDLVGVRASWVCNRMLVQRLEGAVGALDKTLDPAPIGLIPGCTIVPIALRLRRRVAEWTVPMFFAESMFACAEFEEGCRAALVDPTAAMQALRPLATFTEAEIGRLARLLPMVTSDCDRIQRDAASLDGFSSMLTDAYEQIELLHSLAERMSDLGNARQLLCESLSRLRIATRFGWTTLFLRGDSGLEEPGSPIVIGEGPAPFDVARLEAFFEGNVAEFAQASGSLILGDHRAEDLLGDRQQVLVLPVRRAGRVIGLLATGDKQSEDPQLSTYDSRTIDTVGAFLQSFISIAALMREQKEMFIGSVRAITAAVDAKDSYTRGHSERVALLSAQLARKIGLSEAEVARIHIAGILHDVGKIGVPEAVLCKAGRLTKDEFDAIKRHPRIGYEILKGIPELADILPGVLWHHERFDGRGYPDGVAGLDIPLVARLIALADTFDAMSSNRSYRSAVPRARVLDEIEQSAGSQFDPDLARKFIEMSFGDYDRMVLSHTPQRVHTAVDEAA